MPDELSRSQRWTTAGRLVGQLDTVMDDLRLAVGLSGESDLPVGVGSSYRRLKEQVGELRVRLVTASSMSGPAQRDVAKSLKPDVHQAVSLARELTVFLASDSSSLDAEVEHLHLLKQVQRELDSPDLDLSVWDRARLAGEKAKDRLRRRDGTTPPDS